MKVIATAVATMVAVRKRMPSPRNSGHRTARCTAAPAAPIAEKLAANEEAIVSELNAVQGQPAEIGGYYRPDEKLVEAVMRPSTTLNTIVDALR